LLLTVLFRTALFYFLVLIGVRLMGKRELAKLSPLDFVIAVMIAESAVMAVEQPDLPLAAGIIPIATLVTFQVALSLVTMKSQTLRRWINGRPSVVISNGRVDEREMRAARCNIHDLVEQLRREKVALAEVEFAILETGGGLSVQTKAGYRPLRPSDVGMNLPPEELPVILVADGAIDKDALQAIGRDEDWLRERLAAQHAPGLSDILVAHMDTAGEIHVQPKSGRRSLGDLLGLR